MFALFFFFSSRRRHTRSLRDWSSDVCSSDLGSGKNSHRVGGSQSRQWSDLDCPGKKIAPETRRRPRDHQHQRKPRSEEHTSELQSRRDLVCRLLLEKKKKKRKTQREHCKERR